MDACARNALDQLRNIKSVTFATATGEEPAARIIDVMWVDEEGLYFLTGRGKSFHRQLLEGGTVAVSALSPSYVSVRVVGDVRPGAPPGVAGLIFQHNPVLDTLYPGEKRDILDVFQLYRGRGELFDLSSGPPRRERFAFGGATVEPPGFRITEACTACGECEAACPVGAISPGDLYRVDGARCLECGRCEEFCPADAIAAPDGL